MKFRKVIESGIITAALALTSVTTAVSASAAETGTTTESATVNANVADRVSQAASTGVQSVQIIQQNAQAAAEAAEWADKMLVTVDKDSSLNIRKEASADAEVVGKFYAGSGAEVLETGDEWTKVKSGDVEGYVNNAYCVFGEDAHTYAEENCETKATANADGIRVREASNTDAKILDVIDSGASLTVNTDAEEVDGWVSVDCNGTTAYVAADYVDVALNEVPLFIRSGKCIPVAEAAECVKDIDTSKLTMLGYEGSSYTLYEDDGVHKEYDKAENYRKISKNNRMKRSLESLWKFHDEV